MVDGRYEDVKMMIIWGKPTTKNRLYCSLIIFLGRHQITNGIANISTELAIDVKNDGAIM